MTATAKEPATGGPPAARLRVTLCMQPNRTHTSSGTPQPPPLRPTSTTTKTVTTTATPTKTTAATAAAAAQEDDNGRLGLETVLGQVTDTAAT